MHPRYRVRLRRGDIEVEVESSEQSYVDQKLSELLAELTDTVPSPKRDAKTDRSDTPSGSKRSRPDGRTRRSDHQLLDLVQSIREHEDIPAIDNKILSRSPQLPRILLCLYYGELYFPDPYLTTGEVEFVTDQLGVRVRRGNVGAVLKKSPRMVTTDAVRKQGAVVGYKLTRNGKQHFEGLLKKVEH